MGFVNGGNAMMLLAHLHLPADRYTELPHPSFHFLVQVIECLGDLMSTLCGHSEITEEDQCLGNTLYSSFE